MVSGDERRPKREREEPARRERHSERRFREVKERASSRERRDKDRDSPREKRDRVRARDIKERESSRERERRGRDSPRELTEKESSRNLRERDYSSRSRRLSSDRWQGDEQDQDRGGFARGRGRRFSGRQTKYSGDDGYSRQGWRDNGDRDTFPRRQRNSYQGEADKWKHDLFESLVDAPDSTEPEEDPTAKIEALLAS